MSTKVFAFSVLVVLLATVMSVGCVNTTETPGMTTETPGITVPTPVQAAAALHDRGFNAYLLKDYPKALEYYDQALAADPAYIRAYVDKGDALKQLNRSQEAISAYDKALALESNLADVWNSRGEALMITGDYTAALDSFDKALEIAPEFVRAKENRDLAQNKTAK